MTSRERLSAVLRGEIPDCVPVAPDTSNMIPARMTGLDFWDIYLYQEIPLWQAYLSCVKKFGFDSLMDGHVKVMFDDLDADALEYREYIIARTDDRIITRSAKTAAGKMFWGNSAAIYSKDNPPVRCTARKLGMTDDPVTYEPVKLRSQMPNGEALLRLAKEQMGDHGLVGATCGVSLVCGSEEEVYAYYDDPQPFYEKRDRLLEYYRKRFDRLISLPADSRPDFIATGASGTLVFQTVDMFRELGLPIVKEITRLSKEHGLPTHIHSCGPEAQLVKICAEETDLTVIDPLEIPPMGNCNLRELKKLYGDRLVLKGNLHTTDVMLNGTPDDVCRASRQAIDDAAEGGRFILSTGDQCGRDTPDENLYAMIETARTYGRYPLQKGRA